MLREIESLRAQAKNGKITKSIFLEIHENEYGEGYDWFGLTKNDTDVLESIY